MALDLDLVIIPRLYPGRGNDQIVLTGPHARAPFPAVAFFFGPAMHGACFRAGMPGAARLEALCSGMPRGFGAWGGAPGGPPTAPTRRPPP